MKSVKGSKGWFRKISGKLRLFLDALRKFDGDHGFLLSSAITFNFLICMIPIILLLLALIGQYLYSSREVLNHITYHLQNVVPSLDPQIMKNIMRIIRHRKIVGVLGIGGLIWTSTWIFRSLRTVLNIVFQVEKGRGILQGKAIDLLMVLLAGIFLLMSMVLTSAITFVQGYHFSPFLDMKPIIRFTLKYLIPFFFTFCMSFLIYKIIPNKKVNLKGSSGFRVGNTIPFTPSTPFVLSLSKDERHSGQALRLSKGDLGGLTVTPRPNLPASVLPSSLDSNL